MSRIKVQLIRGVGDHIRDPRLIARRRISVFAVGIHILHELQLRQLDGIFFGHARDDKLSGVGLTDDLKQQIGVVVDKLLYIRTDDLLHLLTVIHQMLLLVRPGIFLADELVDVPQLAMRFRGAGLEAREIEQLLDDAVEAHRLAANRLRETETVLRRKR
jgi:hypothetical protein